MEVETTEVVATAATTVDFEFLMTAGVQIAVVVGLTQVIKNFVPEHYHNQFMPVVALILGVAVMVVPAYVDITTWMHGIVLGGTATGLYAVRKEK